MASKKKKRKVDPPEVIPRISKDTLDFTESLNNPSWENERKWASEIMDSIRSYGLRFCLDKLTRGKGSCFFVAVLQQMNRRRVILEATDDGQDLAETMDTQLLRKLVVQMIRTSRNPKVKEIENDYNMARSVIKVPPMLPWDKYLQSMLIETTWADTFIIRATALLLEMNIQIIDIAPNRGPNTYTYNGDPNPETFDEARETLYIGVTNNTHFQSLLPTESTDLDQESTEENSELEEMNTYEVPESNDEREEVSDELGENPLTSKMDEKCPSCRKVFKNLLLHIKKSKKCKITDKELRRLEEVSVNIKKEANRVRKAKSRSNLKNKDPVAIRMKDREYKSKSRAQMKNDDPEALKKKNREYQSTWAENRKFENLQQFKESQNERKSQSRLRLNEANYDLEKNKHWKHQSTYESKKKSEDPESFKELIRQKNAKYRKDENEKDRLKKFLDATMQGPLYICISCHGRLFKISVRNFTEAMAKEIEEKIPIKNCIADMDILTMVVTENSNSIMTPAYKQNKLQVGSRFICETCWRYLKAGKLPPCSVMNSLALHDTDEKLKRDDLWLTELEGSLIAANIIFQKIHLLPRSRWTGLKGKVINVPIRNESINNTLALLPRTPEQAGLIGVSFKRKMEMKNNHKQQLIDPNKVFRMLQKLKEAGSPYHQHLNTPEKYKDLCHETDKNGYETIYSDDEEDMGVSSQVVEELGKESRIEKNSNETEKTSEQEVAVDEEDNPLKKFQFTYDESLCMINKHPELILAPGEGQRPKGITGDKDWDIKAFPHLHNPDGSNGKDQKRQVKLTDQKYFIQRIINREKRFAETSSYLYSAVGYLEEKRIFQNMSLIGSRGKEVKNSNGGISYQLEDEARVLENIPNSPKYWQKMKYEILSKIDNLGPFHLFFTLSCADQRWPATFATILAERGMSVLFRRTEVDGTPVELVEVRTANGSWKPLDQFLKEDMEESKHQLIRGNVVMATRYFHHRVRSFISKIVMARSNPMNVRHYTYKVEFQARGKLKNFFCILISIIFIIL